MPSNGGRPRAPEPSELSSFEEQDVAPEAVFGGTRGLSESLLFARLENIPKDIGKDVASIVEGFLEEVRQLLDTRLAATRPNAQDPSLSEQSPSMSVTPEHLTAVVAAAEARMDARIARIEATTESIRSEIQGVRAEVTDTKNWVRNTFLATLPLIIGTAATVYFGIKSDNQALIANLQAATSGARAEGTVQGQTGVIQGQILEQLKSLSERVDKLATPTAPAASTK